MGSGTDGARFGPFTIEEYKAMSEEADDRLARALFKAFEQHVHVPPELEKRLLRRMRAVVAEVDVDLKLRPHEKKEPQ